MTTKWIYESPDNGKTVIRRPSMSYNDEDRELDVNDDGSWLTLNRLREIGRDHAQGIAMRQKHPQLKELWDSYQTMLFLLREDNNVHR